MAPLYAKNRSAWNCYVENGFYPQATKGLTAKSFINRLSTDVQQGFCWLLACMPKKANVGIV
jgi:hypothetical protein